MFPMPRIKRLLLRLIPIPALCALLASPVPALANGGPIDGSAIKQTGAIRLSNAPDIHLLAEDLSVAFDGDLAQVEVRYTLRNQGPAADIPFGFPVYDSQYIRDDVEQEPALTSFAVLDNGRELEWAQAAQRDPVVVPQCLQDLVDERCELLCDSEIMDMELSWLTSTVSFAQGEDKQLTVRYTLRVQFLDAFFSKSSFPNYSTRLFMYDFSPAAGWGDGRIGSLDIRVDFSRNQDLGMELLALSPGEFLDQGNGVYAMHRENIKADELCSLVLAYNAEDWKTTQFVLENRVPADSLTLTASSAMGGYPVSNLLDNDPATAWVPEGDGVGAWLRIEAPDATVTAVLLVNGYTKSPTLYLANSRASAMDVEIAVTYWDEQVHERSESLELPDLPFDMFRPESFFSFAQAVVDIGDGYLVPPGLTLTVTGVYPGTQYQDLCFSELYVVGLPSFY